MFVASQRFGVLRKYVLTGVPGNLAPPNFAPPPFGNLAPSKTQYTLSLYKLENREASSKAKILKVFVSIYSWFE